MKFKIILIFLLFPIMVFAQTGINGYVRDAKTGEGLAGANVVVGKVGIASNEKGYFNISTLQPGTYKMEVSVIGYRKFVQNIAVSKGENKTVNVNLVEDKIFIDEIVVTATRTENKISQIPGRIDIISPEKLQLTVGQTVDEYLSLLPGVQVSRSFGSFSHKSSVTMRGLSGNEQARTLVLIDGIPVNKADGGSVNWNLISTADVEKVEVVKGPSSAIYGGNAMGGVINVITRSPQKKFEGKVSTEYGTYNTYGCRANFGGKLGIDTIKHFYWAANGFYRQSSGYITQSEADRIALGQYVTKSNFSEEALNLKTGFQNGDKIQAEIDVTGYNDRRGTGEKYYQSEGNTVDHDTYQLRSTVKGKSGKLAWNASVFYLFENYKKVNEWIKDDYTWYNVTSDRTDYGLMSSANYSLKRHKISGGFDIRNGAVNASDIYYTSTDKVDNKGKINFYGVYLEDEISTFSEKLKIDVGLRYDLARYYDGAFIINMPSAETNYLDQYQFSNLSDKVWGAFSPRVSLQYKPGDYSRVYVSYSRGFRPSVLDDLCRTGRIKGGLKVANPDLKPEYLDNFEIGGDYRPVDWVKLSASTYLSLGRDFLYYVSTGDSIDMGYGARPIMIRSNISNVKIHGVEAEISVSPVKNLNIFGNYAYNSSKIDKYTPISENDPTDLTGKYLTDVPAHSFSLGALMQSKVVNFGVTCKYVGEMYVNDQNVYDDIVLSDKYPATFTVDLKFSRDFFKTLSATFSIQNIFDEQIYDNKGAVGPGRFFLIVLGSRF
ncbi:MAG TPA: TonB-dependent receptor [Tenuifilaceae bacterium]|nr:TonB-dependent receptor [Tenuifilaceae bacterium]